MTIQWTLACLAAAAYLLGAMPFGLLVGKAKGVDVRKAGSGNIGATNVGRILGRRYFWVVFALDFLKGAVPMATASALVLARTEPADRGPGLYLLWLAAGLCAILGHTFSVFLGFKGGKGVATSAGVAVSLFPYFTLAGVAAVAVYTVVFLATRYVSLGSIIGAASFPVAYLVLGLSMGWPVFGAQAPLLVLAVVLAGLIIAKHRANIRRLLAGTENRAGGTRPESTRSDPHV